MVGFKKVEDFRANWCSYARLDGKDLEDGEFVEVLWPDGTTTEHDVGVEHSEAESTDMGNPYAIPVKKAFILVEHNEAELRVELLGTKLKVRRMASRKGKKK